MCFSKQIALMRKQKHLTQEELANKLGITFQAVSKWENGLSYPDITLLPTIADIFDCSIDALFEREIKREDLSPEVAALTLTPDLPGMQAPFEGCGLHYDTLPWVDDDILRVAVFRGHEYVGEKLELCKNPEIKEYTVLYQGDVLSVQCNLNLTCGNVEGAANAGGNLTCGDVSGRVNAGGNLNCQNINMAGAAYEDGVSAGGHITCQENIYGNANAGGHIEADSIYGSATAGGNVKVGNLVGGKQSGLDPIGDAVETAIGNALDFSALDQLGENISNAVNAAINRAYGCAPEEAFEDEIEAKVHMAEQKAREWEAQARMWEGRARGAASNHHEGMRMCDKARVSCDNYSGDLYFGNKGKVEADCIQAGNITLQDNGVIEVDQLNADQITMGNGCSISVDTISGTVSLQSGDVSADTIESLAIANGKIEADQVGTVIVSGGHVTVYAENMPKFEYDSGEIE